MPAPDYYNISLSWQVQCQIQSCYYTQGYARACQLCLGVDPGVFQTLGSGGSFLWKQLQHGEEEGAELERFLAWPFIFIQQDFTQTPWLQLCDVPQMSWTRSGVVLEQDITWLLLKIRYQPVGAATMELPYWAPLHKNNLLHTLFYSFGCLIMLVAN